jgi:eukaryotic-like serine/threonine-protein kinase
MEQVGDYELVRPLWTANYGRFFLAKPPTRLRLAAEYVIVKVIDGGTGPDSIRRATRELRTFAAVRSPYLVPLLDAGQQGGTLYYSMEHFELGTLAAPAHPLERGEILRAVADASRAAHALHEAGLAHRDITPTNVMVHPAGAKLADLGLAQCLELGQSMTGLGAPRSVAFMDPAILRGEPPTRATDIWSLGATLHTALSGVGIYGDVSQDPLLVIRRMMSSAPEIDPSLANDDAALIRACLRPDPADRPSTADQLADHLYELVARVAP